MQGLPGSGRPAGSNAQRAVKGEGRQGQGLCGAAAASASARGRGCAASGLRACLLALCARSLAPAPGFARPRPGRRVRRRAPWSGAAAAGGRARPAAEAVPRRSVARREVGCVQAKHMATGVAGPGPPRARLRSLARACGWWPWPGRDQRTHWGPTVFSNPWAALTGQLALRGSAARAKPRARASTAPARSIARRRRLAAAPSRLTPQNTQHHRRRRRRRGGSVVSAPPRAPPARPWAAPGQIPPDLRSDLRSQIRSPDQSVPASCSSFFSSLATLRYPLSMKTPKTAAPAKLRVAPVVTADTERTVPTLTSVDATSALLMTRCHAWGC